MLDGGPDPCMRKGNFEGKGGPLLCIGTLWRELCKTAKPTEMPFGTWTRVGRRKHVSGGVGVQIGAT